MHSHGNRRTRMPRQAKWFGQGSGVVPPELLVAGESVGPPIAGIFVDDQLRSTESGFRNRSSGLQRGVDFTDSTGKNRDAEPVHHDVVAHGAQEVSRAVNLDQACSIQRIPFEIEGYGADL